MNWVRKRPHSVLQDEGGSTLGYYQDTMFLQELIQESETKRRGPMVGPQVSFSRPSLAEHHRYPPGPVDPKSSELSEDLAPGTLQPLSRSSVAQTVPTEALCAARSPSALPVLTLKPGTFWGIQKLSPNHPLPPWVSHAPSSQDNPANLPPWT